MSGTTFSNNNLKIKMHKIIYYDEDGNLMLNEFNLSLPEKGQLAREKDGFGGARGFEVLDNILSGYVVPMFKMAGELHYLYTPDAMLMDKNDHSLRSLRPQELATQGQLEKILEQGDIIGADHALDTHHLLDNINGQSFAQHCDDGLREAVRKVLNAKDKPFEYDSVMVITNSGLGHSTSITEEEDGVIRDENGFGYAIRKDGEINPFYERGLENSYQNTGKTHFHIIPIPNDIKDELVMEYITQVQSIHGIQQVGTLHEYRKTLKNTSQEDVGVISIAYVDETNLNQPLNFLHYSDSSLNENSQGITMSSFAGSTLRKLYGDLKGIDFNDKEQVKNLRIGNIGFYKNNIF